MTNRIFIAYDGDPIKALERVRREHGDGPALIMIPDKYWHLFQTKGTQQQVQHGAQPCDSERVLSR